MISDLELNLDSNAPPTVWFSAPWVANGYGMLGKVTCGDFTFCAAQNKKISYVERFSANDRMAYMESLKINSTLAISELDTNAALKAAIAWLDRGKMDSAALMRDARPNVRYWHIGDSHFVPLYWVSWAKDGRPLALVTFFTPNNSLIQLRVEKDAYNKRKQIIVPDSVK
jgi:hypothetical protein